MSIHDAAHDPSVGVRRRHLPSCAGEAVTRHFFSTFQNTVGPAEMKPVTFLRAADTRRHSPKLT